MIQKRNTQTTLTCQSVYRPPTSSLCGRTPIRHCAANTCGVGTGSSHVLPKESPRGMRQKPNIRRRRGPVNESTESARGGACPGTCNSPGRNRAIIKEMSPKDVASVSVSNHNSFQYQSVDHDSRLRSPSSPFAGAFGIGTSFVRR